MSNARPAITHRRVVIAIALLLAGAVTGVIGCGGTSPEPAASTEPAREMFDKAKSLYERQKWEKAKVAFEAFIFSHPGAAFVDSGQFLLAMSNVGLRDYIVAADEFKRLHVRYPASPLVEQADLLRCQALLKIAPRNATLDQEKTLEAITELNLFIDSRPLSPHMAVADSLLREAHGRLSRRDYRAAFLYHRLGRYEAARIYFQQVVDNYTDSPYVPDCLYYMAEGYRHQDSTDRAIEYYEKMLYLYPDHERASKAKKRIAALASDRDTAHAEE